MQGPLVEFPIAYSKYYVAEGNTTLPAPFSLKFQLVPSINPSSIPRLDLNVPAPVSAHLI
jgi:hypothetical protein